MRLEDALFYLKRWNAPVIFTDEHGVPLHEWRGYAEAGQSPAELLVLWRRFGRRAGKRLAVSTGPYQRARRERLLVIDVDRLPPGVEKERLAKTYAREGFVVVETARGLHLHALVTGDVYIVSLRDRVDNVTYAEGAVLHPHLWTVPPAKRPLGDGGAWFSYRFVLPDGRRLYRPEERQADALTPRLLGDARSVAEAAAAWLGATPYFGAPRAGAAPQKLGEPGGWRRPVFRDLREMLMVAPSVPTPLCVAWVLLGYYYAEGLHTHAALLQAQYPALRPPVPRGRRFLTAAAFLLTVAHLVDDARWDDVIAILSRAVEDWPYDDGGGLDKKLSYLVYVDNWGRVYPRYSGLGALSPEPVYGNLVESCWARGACGCRRPWHAWRVLLSIRGLVVNNTGRRETSESSRNTG